MVCGSLLLDLLWFAERFIEVTHIRSGVHQYSNMDTISEHVFNQKSRSLTIDWIDSTSATGKNYIENLYYYRFGRMAVM